MPSNVFLKFKKIWSSNLCCSHIQIKFTITILKCWKIKTQNKLFKIRTLDVDSSIQIWIQFPEQNKTKINRKVIRNFKKELQTLNSYTLSFKKQVLTHQEENDNNIAKTARAFDINGKSLQRWNNQRDVILKAVQNKRVRLLLYIISKDFLLKTKKFPDIT